jgi:glycosyltransferase involved in cell wall biosynthesis
MSEVPGADDGSPRVTIGLPVFNGERYLEAALRSIEDQTYSDFEVVISDNASTDATQRICEAFVEKDPRFKYVRQPENHGGTWNFNHVAELARGEYFKWAAHDDVIEPTFLQVCVEALDAAPPEVLLVYPKTSLIDENGDVIDTYEDRLDLRHPRPSDRYRTFLRYHVLSNALFGLFRLDQLKRTRLFGLYPESDIVTFVELALLGQIWELPPRLFLRREHPQRATKAYATSAVFNTWHNPGADAARIMPRSRIIAESLWAIRHAPITRVERIRSYLFLIRAWTRRYATTVLKEFLTEGARLGSNAVSSRRRRGAMR